jgi:hypothetical protein
VQAVRHRTSLAIAFVVAAVALAAGQARPSDAQQRRRDQIQMMESVLTRAVRQGAEQLGRRLQSNNPSVVLFTGDARARGFLLDDYGVFFDVEIPNLRQSVVWTMRTLDRDAGMSAAIEALRHTVESLPESPSRLQAEQALKRVELEVGPPPQLVPPLGGAPSGAPAPGFAAGASTVPPPAAPSPGPLSVEEQDPDAAYTEAVKRALIDAMLDYGVPMELGPDEWLTVAARSGEGPMISGQIDDAMTILLRVKGSDLAAFAADRGKREEVRKRVEVRVF